MYKVFIPLAFYAIHLGFVTSVCSELNLGLSERILAGLLFSWIPFVIGIFAAKSVLLEWKR